ncbi:hypothetical protein OROMI_000504 [Orobanche minor]
MGVFSYYVLIGPQSTSRMEIDQAHFPSTSLRNACFGGPLAVNSDGTLVACAQGTDVIIVNVIEPSKFRCFKATHPSKLISALALNSYEDDDDNFRVTGSIDFRIPDREHHVSRIAYCRSRGETLVVTVGLDKKVIVWEIGGRKRYACSHPKYFVIPGPVIYLAAHGTGMVNIVENLQMNTSFHNGAVVTSLGGNLDGKIFITLDRDKVLKIWSREAGLDYPSIPSHDEISAVTLVYPNLSVQLDGWNGLSDFEIEPDSVCFITVGPSLKAWVCSPKSHKLEGGRFCCHDVGVSSGIEKAIESFKSVTFYSASDDTGLMFLTKSGELIFCDLEIKNSKIYLKTTERLQGYIDATNMVFFPGHRFLAFAAFTSSDQVRVVDVESSMACVQVVPLGGHGSDVLCLDTCITSDGTKLIVTWHEDTKVRLWDVRREVFRAVTSHNLILVSSCPVTMSFVPTNVIHVSRHRTSDPWPPKGTT